METLKKHQVLLLFTLLALSFFAYFPAVTADFASLDDIYILASTNNVSKFNVSTIFNIFTADHLGLYHPLVTLSFAVERLLFGMIPAFYHVDNMLLHLFNTVLVFLIFARLTKSFAVTYIISFLFAIHPVHVEVVAWISARKDTLYSVFYLLAFLLYIKTYDGKKTKTLIFLSSLCFILSCFSKAMAITLPLVLILTDYFQNRLSKKNIRFYLPYFIISAVFIAVGIWSHYRQDMHTTFVFLTLAKNIINAHFHVLFYMYKFILPVNLYCMYHPFYNASAMPPLHILISPAIVYALIFAALLSLKKTKKIFFGFLFFLIVLLPSSGILPMGIAPVADRYVYLAFTGLFFIAAEGAVRLYSGSNKFFKIILIFFAVVLGAALVYLSFNRSLDWQKERFGPPNGQPGSQLLSGNMSDVVKSMEFDKRNEFMKTLAMQRNRES